MKEELLNLIEELDSNQEEIARKSLLTKIKPCLENLEPADISEILNDIDKNLLPLIFRFCQRILLLKFLLIWIMIIKSF